ncbi:amino acid adenylation domain-containing protein [Corallococcus coralloides]|uniref:hybrid non-ribosomal peptide synthetase/type I polyketide synthase n=1 Tax=Corallococcus coralloides TaxID=184914 RepID=UPI00384B62B7
MSTPPVSNEASNRDELLQRALERIREFRGKLDAVESQRSEPIAVVGMSCRLPGGNDDPSSLWRFLRSGGDGIRAFPQERGAGATPDGQPFKGGFLEQVDRFDAGVFGISPREAATLDPQQRLFLEVSWEALENAAQPFDKLEGSMAGVFVGITNYDYCQKLMQETPIDQLDAYCLTSNASTFAAGRLSYWLGLRGPSLSVDTACSSSAVALHQACQSLRAGECSLALAGGVNVLLSPEWFVVLSRAGMLSPDGYCKTFDRDANGYTRGEGCVVFVLKRLSDAVAAKDHIHALIRGSCVNQDGRSGGLTVPNPAAQQDVIRGALKAARVGADRVSYVETHGTGTPLGDPIEVRALGAALGEGRADGDRIHIGSIKANIGHLEPAAGAAGLMKVILALQNEELPPQVQFRELNPEIDLEALPVAISTRPQAWPRAERPRIAGVSSFGASGTNAHLVVEEAPAVVRPARTFEPGTQLFTLSARSPAVLARLAGRHASHLASHRDLLLEDVCFSVNTGRARFAERVALPVDDLESLQHALSAIAAGELPAGASLGRAQVGQGPKVAFLFTGQGSQFPGMAVELHASQPVFRQALDRCAEALKSHWDVPLLTLLRGEGFTAGLLDQTRYTQAALFSVEYALAMLWKSWGVVPAAVLGHSVGEYVAACVAGVFEPEAAVALLAVRGALMQALPAAGAMASVFAGEAQVRSALEGMADRVSVAAVNAPDNIVISGQADAVEQVLQALTAQGHKHKRINVSQAFHSPLLDPMLDALEQAASGLTFQEPSLPLISNLTGRPVEPGTLGPRYLRDHAREAVRFQASMEWLFENGFDTFVEVGPAPHLIGMVKRYAPAGDRAFLPSMRKGLSAQRSMLESAGALYTRGADLEWDHLHAGLEPRRVPLPTYTFDRKRYWYAAPAPGAAARSSASVQEVEAGSTTLLGHRLPSPLPAAQFRVRYDAAQHPCLADCRMGGMRVVNVGVFLEAALQSWHALTPGAGACRVDGLSVRRGLLMDDDETRVAHLVVEPPDAKGERSFALHSLPPGASEDSGAWAVHVEGRLAEAREEKGLESVDAILARCERTLDGAEFYARMEKRQLVLGHSARWIEQVRFREGEALATMRAPDAKEAEGYRVHPGLVDALFQAVFACLPGDVPEDAIYMIVEVARFVVGPATPAAATRAHVRLRPWKDGDTTIVADVDVADAEGRVFLRAEGALLKRTTVQALQKVTRAEVTPATSAARPASSGLRDVLSRLQVAERTPRLVEWLRAQVAVILRASASDVDVDAPLAHAGFDSLMALELKSAVANELNVALSLGGLLAGASLKALCSEILGQLSLEAPPASGAVEPARTASAEAAPVEALVHDGEGRHQPFGMTDLQQAYLLGRTRSFELGGVSTYFFLEVDLLGVDLERLGSSLDVIIQRHDMLRAVVTPDGQQRVLSTVPSFVIRTVDLRGQDAAQVERALAALRTEMATQVFQTDRFPLFDVRATRLDGERTRLHLGFDALVVDAWSTSLLFKEWSAVYREGAGALRPIDITFRDYVLGVQALESGPAYAAAEKYWLERVPKLPPAPELPMARHPGTLELPRFTHRSFRLPKAQWARFKELAREAGVTPSMVMCAAYSEVLATWGRSRAFTLNVLFFNRVPLHPHVDRVLGNFSATTLLEVQVERAESIASRAQRLQQQLWNDLDHASFSGVRVLRELNRRDGDMRRARMPIVYASTINFHSREGDAAPAGLAQHLLTMGTGGEEIHSSIRTPQVFLDHQVVEDGGGLVLNWDVVEELFPAGMIDAMFQAYSGLVTRLAAEPAAWTERTRLLVPVEQLDVRRLANATAAPVAQGLMHEPFVRAAALQPDRPAIITARRTLTYGELDAASNRVAHWLREQGARPNALVALVMEKGWEQVVAALGVLKAGAAYVPIDAHLPPARLRYLLENTDARQVLTQSWLTLDLSGVDPGAVLAIDGPEAQRPPADALPSVQRPEDLAYVIYTSGSTGHPKGVMIEHRAALNTLLDVNTRYGVDADSRGFALSAMNFDLSVWDVFGLLAAGGALVIPQPGDLREPGRWLHLVREHRVTVWNSVPALMEMMADHLAGLGETWPQLKTVMMSGDWIPVSLPERIRAVAPNAAVYSMGGATEAAIWSIVYPIGDVDPAWPSIPYGKAMLNQQMLVLDDALMPCPTWVPGQIFIGGVGVARGYWRDEEKTRASFIRHPLTGERLYRTGDLGRFLPSGDIEFLGREDFQVKVQGFRIELGEIENALLQHPGVRAAVASAVGEKRGNKRLVAYVVLDAEAPPALDALREALRTKLPEYMVPQTFVTLDSLPLSANGKVDRGALPALEGTQQPKQTGVRVPPRTELEKTLTGLWEGLLPGPVGIHDNFFEVGGNSLLAVRLMARLRQELGRELPLATLFEMPTVALLAASLEGPEAPRREGRGALVPIQPSGTRPPLFLVHPVGGSVLCYAELARKLGADQPVFGLQVPPGAPPRSIEAMAAAYLEALRDVQPRGPYHLGGWSMGGVVAYEMARQLQAAGDTVSTLALIDVLVPPAGQGGDAMDEAALMARFAEDLGALSARRVSVDAGALRALPADAVLERVVEDLRAQEAIAPELDRATLGAHAEVFKANMRALTAYQARPYAGRVWFCRGAQPGGASRQNAEAWLGLTSGGQLVELEGNHYTLFSHGLDALVGSLSSALRA